MKDKKQSGFTLIELLVVVLIIGILSAIALPQYAKSVAKARFASAIVRLNAIEKQVELYALEQPAIPSGGAVAIMYDPATFSGGASWLQYGGGTEINAGLTCDEGNLHHVCHDDYYTFSSVCWPSGSCTIDIYSRNSEYEISLSLRHQNGVWTKKCSCRNKSEFLCKSLQGNWEIKNKDNKPSWML